MATNSKQRRGSSIVVLKSRVEEFRRALEESGLTFEESPAILEDVGEENVRFSCKRADDAAFLKVILATPSSVFAYRLFVGSPPTRLPRTH